MENPKVYQIVGYKNSGKTTLICKLLPIFIRQGYQVGTIKHDAHGFELDEQGRDTWKYREAGASIQAISSPSRTAWLSEQPMGLDALLPMMHAMDFTLVEGYKHERYKKLVMIRDPQAIQLCAELLAVDAIACWPEMMPHVREWSAGLPCPVFAMDDNEGIAEHIMTQIKG